MHRLCSIALLALLVASCDESPTAPGSDLDAVAIGVSVAPTTIVAGAKASVVVALRNTSAHPVEISACPIYFWVQGSGGQIVGGSDGVFCFEGSLVYQPLRFGPFERKQITFEWNETQNVAPGLYDIFGWANLPEHASTPVPITVLPAN
jgi:hypothetical protein